MAVQQCSGVGKEESWLMDQSCSQTSETACQRSGCCYQIRGRNTEQADTARVESEGHWRFQARGGPDVHLEMMTLAAERRQEGRVGGQGLEGGVGSPGERGDGVARLVATRSRDGGERGMVPGLSDGLGRSGDRQSPV